VNRLECVSGYDRQRALRDGARLRRPLPYSFQRSCSVNDLGFAAMKAGRTIARWDSTTRQQSIGEV
jgi:hypothetical protein